MTEAAMDENGEPLIYIEHGDGTRPREFAPLRPGDKLWIYDTSTGATIWEGFAE